MFLRHSDREVFQRWDERSSASLQSDGGAAAGRRRWRLARVVTALIAAMILPFAGAVPAQAVYFPGGMNSQVFCVQNPSVNPTWLTPINNGRNAWNNHGSFPGDIVLFSGCTSTLHVGSYGDTWYGHYTALIVGAQYTIRLDSVNINNHVNANGYTFANVVKSTTAHEFGHALRLGDHTNFSARLMSSSRNRNLVTFPTIDEVLESNSYY